MRIQTLLTASLLIVAASVASADITVTSSVEGTGLAKMADGDTTAYIKGKKMRTQQESARVSLATIIDLESDQYVVMQTNKEKAEVYTVNEIAAAQRAIGAEDISVSIKATGETREILDWKCDEHEIKIVVNAANPGAPDMAMDVVVTGNVCLAPDAPGAQEYADFYAEAAKQGLFFGDPKAAEAQPGREKAMTELYRAMAEKGLPLYSEITVGFEGSGMLAAMMKRMGVTMTTTVTSVSTDAIADEMFEIPKGYKVKNK